MGMFDNIGKVWQTLDRAGKGARQQLFGLITGKSGGLSGLVDQFKAQGLAPLRFT